jgi:hypothetical protein
MTFRIPAGKHRARPWRPRFWWRRTHFSWIVKFDESCRYDLGTDDQFDTNKLVGIGYLSRPRFIVTKYFNKFWFWRLKPMHWTHSARFGWRYWTERKEIELSAYCYVSGRRVIQHICFCEIGKEYRIELRKLSTMYFFHAFGNGKLMGVAEVPYDHSKVIGYRLGTFFGGQSTCDHDITIEIKRA